jgi:thiol:disulfide interchange protein DsbC
METRQDLTAARLLEINPDMLVGGAAKANAAAAEGEGQERKRRLRRGRGSRRPRPRGRLGWRWTDFRRTARSSGAIRADGHGLHRLPVWLLPRADERAAQHGRSGRRAADLRFGSRDIADRVYCAKNREEALHAAYAGEPLKAARRRYARRASMPTRPSLTSTA